MRKIFLFMNVSLDGYIATPDHDLSWAHTPDNQFEAFSLEQSRDVDTLLFGRKTFEMMRSYWPTPHAKENQPEIARFMNERAKVVASHQAFEPGWDKVTVINGNVVEQVRQLKEGPGQTIGIFGSNTLCNSLLAENLIDEFQIMINLVALGAGISLFKGLSKQTNFTQLETRQFGSGKVLLTFAPAKS